jgi:hypothetical protein
MQEERKNQTVRPIPFLINTLGRDPGFDNGHFVKRLDNRAAHGAFHPGEYLA